MVTRQQNLCWSSMFTHRCDGYVQGEGIPVMQNKSYISMQHTSTIISYVIINTDVDFFGQLSLDVCDGLVGSLISGLKYCSAERNCKHTYIVSIINHYIKHNRVKSENFGTE